MMTLPQSGSAERLAWLEQQIGVLQEQLAQLALQVLQEKLRLQSPLKAPEAPSALVSPTFSATPTSGSRPIHPADLRGRERAISRIEYDAQKDKYRPVCPQTGILTLTPDSPEWFDWLASIMSFRFVGKGGNFTACRDTSHGKRTRTWIAHRSIQGHLYKHYLGITDHLTIALLEQAAAQLQSHLPVD